MSKSGNDENGGDVGKQPKELQRGFMEWVRRLVKVNKNRKVKKNRN